MYRINVYVPLDYADTVKQAMFDAGAGRIGLYEHCCWQTLGHGQFRPLAGNQAFIGETGQLETLEELKIEMVCEARFIKAVITQMKKAHPYEEPAYDVYQALVLDDFN